MAVSRDRSVVERPAAEADTDRTGGEPAAAEEEKQAELQPEAGGADRSRLGLRWTGPAGASAAQSSRVRAAVDAALSPGSPPPPESQATQGLPAAGESVAGYRLLTRLRGDDVTAMYRALGGAGPVLLKLRRDDGELAVQAAAHARLAHPGLPGWWRAGRRRGWRSWRSWIGARARGAARGGRAAVARPGRGASLALEAAEALAAAAALGVLHGELGLDQILVARAWTVA